MELAPVGSLPKKLSWRCRLPHIGWHLLDKCLVQLTITSLLVNMTNSPGNPGWVVMQGRIAKVILETLAAEAS